MRRLPPLTALRAFEAAARHLSFVKAADELAVTPAAISHQVKTLEQTLGVALFDRLPRGLRLTDPGQAYFPELSKGFDHLARAAAALDRDLPRGRLRLSAAPTLVSGWLASRIGRFAAAYPEIQVEVISDGSAARFGEDAIDVALRYGAGRYQGYAVVPLLSEDIFPVAAPRLLNQGQRLDRLADLAQFPLLVDIDVTAAEPWNTWDSWFRLAGLDPGRQRPVLCFTDYKATEEAAIQGAGLMLARSVPSAQALAEGRLIRPLEDKRPADYSYYLVMPRAAVDVPKVSAFIAWALQEAGQSLAPLENLGGYRVPLGAEMPG